MDQKKILILDYSTDRSEAGYYRRWLPSDAQVISLFVDSAESLSNGLLELDFTHVIHSGSALSITQDAPFTQKVSEIIQQFVIQNVFQMGICYGHQLLCRALIGPQAVSRSPNGLEVGWKGVNFDLNQVKIPGVGERECVWQHHYDEVSATPSGSLVFASNSHSNIQGFFNPGLHLMGTQFHPEFDRDTGNTLFLKDRQNIEKHGYNVDEMVRQGPSIDTGRLFFNYFLDQ